jgi:hypothetical protein
MIPFGVDIRYGRRRGLRTYAAAATDSVAAAEVAYWEYLTQ